MQLYVLDRAKNTLATTASFYNDKHHKELTAGASTIEITVDKTDDAAQYMQSGNFLVFQDDRGRAWSFTILSYDETQTARTVFAEDVSIELLNKAMDVWNMSQAYPFSYYFDLVTKDTPWKLGVNQLTDLSRKLTYTGRDTGLGRLLSILKGFDNAECQFNVVVQQNKPVTFTVDVYKSIGTVQDNIQIVYNNELSDIKKTESRAQFVTALSGVGGLVENQATTDPGLEKHIDFADIDYKDDNFISPKGDKFLRAVTANKTFNPGTTSYIEDFYDYDTQSAQELLNRTLTQLKERSEPQYTYEADVKIIDPTLDIGDTVTIIDHDYQPALYLSARVATLDKSYIDPTQGSITFCNYRVLNSTLSDQLRAMQNIIDQMPTSSSVKLINSNIVTLITQNEDLKKQVTLALKSADGKSTIYFDAKPSTAQEGDVAFVKNADGVTEIWKFAEGTWKLDTGIATFDDVKKAASAAADAGSQAVIAGQQASAAGADAKSAGDFAASAASQSTIETAAAQSAANSAVDQAKSAISQAGFANNAADQAKSAAASAQSDAADALAEATKSFNDAQNAISNATKAMDAAEQNRTTVTGLVTKVDDIAGTIQTLATTQSVDKLAGTVTTVQSLAQFAADGLKLKADSSTVSSLDGRVTKLSGQLDVQANLISAKVTANDVTGMLGNYATQSWSEGKISAAKNEITASVQNMTSDMATQTWTQGKLDLTASGFKTQISSVKDGLTKQYTQLQQTLDGVQVTANNAVTQGQLTLLSNQFTSTISGIQVGGTNLLKGTAKCEFPLNSNGGTQTVQKYDDETNYIQHTSNTPIDIMGPWTGIFTPEVGQVYTLSADISGNGYTAGWIFHYEGSGDGSLGRVDLTDNWQRISNTFRVNTISGNWAIYANNSTLLKIKHIKIEKGNKPTDWSPAPEDQATVADVSSQITQLQNDINLRVKTGDLVSQIDVNVKGILLDGASTYITNTTHIDTGVIKAAMIDDAAITNAAIGDAAVSTAKIANAAITAAKIADLTVGSAQIADGAISTAKIGTAAITSAKIADASILDAKIVNLDGSKIVAHSITADQLDVNAIAVGLNTYGSGWQITPASIAFLPVGTTHTTISLSGDMGITYGDLTTGEILGHTYGTPYNTKAGMDWFNGISTVLKYNGADYWAVLSEESDSTVRPRLTYSNRRMAKLGVFQGWTFDDNTHFATIGPMDSDDNAQMKVVRLKIGDRWATGFKNSNTNAANQAGIAFTDDGATFFGRSGVWWNLYDILKKQGANV